MHPGAVDRFRFRFKNFTYRSIRICLADSQGVAATILLCCALDLLATFHSGSPDKRQNKRKYISFLRTHFPATYNPEDFYAFVRCGLVHAYSIENRYYILCRDDRWARDRHMKVDPRDGRIVVNPYALFQDLNYALEKYVHHARVRPDAHARFRAVHRVIPLKRPQIRWKKARSLAASPK